MNTTLQARNNAVLESIARQLKCESDSTTYYVQAAGEMRAAFATSGPATRFARQVANANPGVLVEVVKSTTSVVLSIRE